MPDRLLDPLAAQLQLEFCTRFDAIWLGRAQRF
jgi:hypothetical protein